MMSENSLSSMNLGTVLEHSVSPITNRIQQQFINEARGVQPPSVENFTISGRINEEIDGNDEIQVLLTKTTIKQEKIDDKAVDDDDEIKVLLCAITTKQEKIDDEISPQNLTAETSGNNLFSHQNDIPQNTSSLEIISIEKSPQKAGNENDVGTSGSLPTCPSKDTDKFKKVRESFGASSNKIRQEPVTRAEISKCIENLNLSTSTYANVTNGGNELNICSQELVNTLNADASIIDLTVVSSDNASRTEASTSQSVFECVDHIEEVVSPNLLRNVASTRNPHSTSISVELPSGTRRELSLLSTIPNLSQIFAMKCARRPSLDDCDDNRSCSKDIHPSK
ncbi:hypothetical protein AVEN_89222-1, partial [Araneus ventricosus]